MRCPFDNIFKLIQLAEFKERVTFALHLHLQSMLKLYMYIGTKQ